MLRTVLQPKKIKGVEFSNRIVMAPMYPFGWLGEDGEMPPKTLGHYLRRADVGIGLMVCQALHVAPCEDAGRRPGIYSDRHIPSLEKIADACHRGATGTKFFVQLAYSPAEDRDTAGTFNAMPTAELESIRDEFIRAALRCKAAGCDGIELHGAHGFWLNTAASPTENRREDAYGGDLAGRLRLAREIVGGIRAFAGDRFVIAYRMGWNDSLPTDRLTAQALESFGVDLLHVSSGIPQERPLDIPTDFGYNEVVFTGCEVKKAVQIPVIVVNDIRTLGRGEELLERGLCDFVAYGKPLLADGLFARKSVENPAYQPCLQCGECQWFTDGDRCPVKQKLDCPVA